MPTQNIFMYICIYVSVFRDTYNTSIRNAVGMNVVLFPQRRIDSSRLRSALTCFLSTSYRKLVFIVIRLQEREPEYSASSDKDIDEYVKLPSHSTIPIHKAVIN